MFLAHRQQNKWAAHRRNFMINTEMNCQETLLTDKQLAAKSRLQSGKVQRLLEKYRLLNNQSKRPVPKRIISHGKDIVQIKFQKARTGTSFFRLEIPLYSLAKNYPDKFNLVYADNNLNPKHLQIADLIVQHRAGHLHSWAEDVMKAWPKTSSKKLIVHDKN